MKIESNELRQKLNKIPMSVGFVSMADVKAVIKELEDKEKENSEFYQFFKKL